MDNNITHCNGWGNHNTLTLINIIKKTNNLVFLINYLLLFDSFAELLLLEEDLELRLELFELFEFELLELFLEERERVFEFLSIIITQ